MYYCRIVLLKSFLVPWAFCAQAWILIRLLRILLVTFIAEQASGTARYDYPQDASLFRALPSP